jgi:hypothetical protein
MFQLAKLRDHGELQQARQFPWRLLEIEKTENR